MRFKKLFLLTFAWRRVGCGYGSVKFGYGSEDPDQYKNLSDPEHWLQASFQSSRVASKHSASTIASRFASTAPGLGAMDSE